MMIRYLCTVMFATAIFYGVKQNTAFGDIAASFLISLIGTAPVLLTKKIMINAAPKVIARSIELEELKELDVDVEGLDHLDHLDHVDVEEDDQEALQRRTTMAYHTNLDLIKTHKMKTRQSTLRSALSEVKKTKSKAAQIKLANDTRSMLFHTLYPLDHRYKRWAWIFMVVWTVFVVIMAMNYGIQFDLKYDAVPNAQNSNLAEYDEECWSNDKRLVIEELLSVRSLQDLQASLESHFSGDYDAQNTESWKWLLSMLQSLLLSIFLWQPLTVYLMTWIKIHLFSWNLRMKLAPSNVLTLCKRACSRSAHPPMMLDQNNDDAPHPHNKSAYFMMAHQNRPLDVIGYFSNDELFLRIDEETGKLREIGSDYDDHQLLDDDDDDDDDHRLLSTHNDAKQAITTTDDGMAAGENQEAQMEMVAVSTMDELGAGHDADYAE